MEKGYTGAPFGVTSVRFSQVGMHPNLFGSEVLYYISPSLEKASKKKRKKKTMIETLMKKFNDAKQSQITASKKELMSKKANQKMAETRKRMRTAVKEQKTSKIHGMKWKLQLETEHRARVPYVLNMEKWKAERLRKQYLAAGRYNVAEASDKLYEPCGATKGIMESTVPRFTLTAGERNNAPGPGAYGSPADTIEEEKQAKANMHSSWARHPDIANKIYSEGTGLPPNLYRVDRYNCINEYVSRVISKVGPYELFSQDRWKPIRTGWNPVTEKFDCKSVFAPPSDTEAMSSKAGGKFSIHSKDSYPTGRLPIESNSHSYYKPIGPGPTAYTLPTPKTPKSFNVANVPFNIRSEKFDAQALSNFVGVLNADSPGRYFDMKAKPPYPTCNTNIGWKHYSMKGTRNKKAAGNRVTVANLTPEDVAKFTLNVDASPRPNEEEKSAVGK